MNFFYSLSLETNYFDFWMWFQKKIFILLHLFSFNITLFNLSLKLLCCIECLKFALEQLLIDVSEATYFTWIYTIESNFEPESARHHEWSSSEDSGIVDLVDEQYVFCSRIGECDPVFKLIL